MSDADEKFKSSKDAHQQPSAIEGAWNKGGRIELEEQAYLRAAEILERDAAPMPELIKLMRRT